MIKKQRGVTLIELMVSMMLGLALVAGISQLFIQSQKSFKLQRNLSDMTDDASFVLEALAKGVYQAGASKNGTTNFPEDLNVIGSGFDFLGSQCVTDTNGRNCEYIKGDDNAFIYRFQFSDPLELNTFLCNTTLTYIEDDIVSIYIYKANDGNGTPVFYCKVKQSSGAAQNAEPLISEIKRLDVHYVVRNKNNENDLDDDTFYTTTAANITDWKKVVAVKVYIVLRSVDDKLTRTPATYKIEDTEYTATDNRLYKVFSKMIKLRSADH
ncbi:MAG: PilW family protein [Methylococcales bacterium]|nr:PilW family protein [Methylococcales bacterium]MDD5753948.1 PilW family protein [Methylococcales bacterium]